MLCVSFLLSEIQISKKPFYKTSIRDFVNKVLKFKLRVYKLYLWNVQLFNYNWYTNKFIDSTLR